MLPTFSDNKPDKVKTSIFQKRMKSPLQAYPGTRSESPAISYVRSDISKMISMISELETRSSAIKSKFQPSVKDQIENLKKQMGTIQLSLNDLNLPSIDKGISSLEISASELSMNLGEGLRVPSNFCGVPSLLSSFSADISSRLLAISQQAVSNVRFYLKSSMNLRKVKNCSQPSASKPVFLTDFTRETEINEPSEPGTDGYSEEILGQSKDIQNLFETISKITSERSRPEVGTSDLSGAVAEDRNSLTGISLKVDNFLMNKAFKLKDIAKEEEQVDYLCEEEFNAFKAAYESAVSQIEKRVEESRCEFSDRLNSLKFRLGALESQLDLIGDVSEASKKSLAPIESMFNDVTKVGMALTDRPNEEKAISIGAYAKIQMDILENKTNAELTSLKRAARKIKMEASTL